MSTMIGKFKKSGRRTQGIILTSAGVILCFLSFIFVEDWNSRYSVMENIVLQDVMVFKGIQVPVKSSKYSIEGECIYEGQITVPLKLVLASGIILAGVGLAFIAIASKRESEL